MTTFIAASADVDERAGIGAGSAVWQLAQVREGAVLGAGCVVGRGAYVGVGVRLGRHVKVQNYALVYEPATLADGVFVGPGAVLTNDQYPRSVDPDGALKRGGDWEAVGVTVGEGASIGARAVCVAPVTIGRWAMVAAGAVVTREVPDFALVAGTPARWLRWVGRAGVPLERLGEGRAGRGGSEEPTAAVGLSRADLAEVRPAAPHDRPAGPPQAWWRCPRTGATYFERAGTLTELPADADRDPVPADAAVRKERAWAR